MYSQFTITHRLRTDNMIFELRDFEQDHDDEIEFTLEDYGFTCALDPAMRSPMAYWRLPASDQWIPQRQIGLMPADLPIKVRVPRGHGKNLVCIVTDQPEQSQWSSQAVAAALRMGSSEIFNISNFLMRELQEERVGQQDMITALGKMLTLHVERKLGRYKSDDTHTLVPWRMRKIEAAIGHAAGGGELDLEKLADDCRMSKKYLLSQFLQATGQSMNHYLWSAKADRAKQMIEQGYKFDVIADRLDFSGPSHFTSRFTLHAGVTPSEYRRQMKIAGDLDQPSKRKH